MSNNCDGLSTLTRSQVTSETVNAAKLANILKLDDPWLIFKSRAELEERRMLALKKLFAMTKAGDYSGVFHGVSFQINRKISLESLGFWGPFTDQIGEYRVVIKIFQLSTLAPLSKNRTPTPSIEMERRVRAERKKLFWVPLSQPLILESDKWTKIEFMLNGPKTFRCESLPRECRGDDGLIFSFALSSHQLPALKYKVVK